MAPLPRTRVSVACYTEKKEQAHQMQHPGTNETSNQANSETCAKLQEIVRSLAGHPRDHSGSVRNLKMNAAAHGAVPAHMYEERPASPFSLYEVTNLPVPAYQCLCNCLCSRTCACLVNLGRVL